MQIASRRLSSSVVSALLPCVFLCAHTPRSSSLPPLFSLTRLGFLWCGDVAVNPVNAGCDVMTSELEYSGRLEGFGFVRAFLCTPQHQLSSSAQAFNDLHPFIPPV